LQPCDVGPFARLKPLLEKEIHQFPIHHRGQCPIRDDLPRLSTKPWLLAFAPDACTSGFANTGIWPLCKTKMLQKIVGSQPCPTTTPMHTTVARLIKPVLESSRNLAKLKRAGVDPDAAVAVICNLEFYASLLPTTKRRRRGGTFLDEEAAARLTTGGVCLNTTQMKEIMANKEDERAMKEATKAANAAARIAKRAAAAQAKEAKIAAAALAKEAVVQAKVAKTAAAAQAKDAAVKTVAAAQAKTNIAVLADFSEASATTHIVGPLAESTFIRDTSSTNIHEAVV